MVGDVFGCAVHKARDVIVKLIANLNDVASAQGLTKHTLSLSGGSQRLVFGV